MVLIRGLCFAICVLGLLACNAATARVEREVRVLVYRGAESIQIGTVGSPVEVRSNSSDALFVGGQEKAQPWAPIGAGPWRVGSRIVRGEISVDVEAGKIRVLNRIALEDYVASTVGGEMSPSWPAEALRAQAVAARTYVLYKAGRRRNAQWDVRATAASQVYRGVEAETKETRAATRATAGQVLTFAGKPILAVFHSTAGGRTATAEEVWGEDLPYLRVVEVEDEDDAPNTYWRTDFPSGSLQGVLEAAGISVGRLESLRVASRTQSGRVQLIVARGSLGSEEVGGKLLRDLLRGIGLHSTLFEIRETTDGFTFVGSGHGHGVGMSQWGARAMARQGASYARILARFYPGARLEKLSSRRIALSAASRLSEGDHE